MERAKSDEAERMTLTETLHGIVCQVCNKRFSGRVPAQQHLQSEAHNHKVQQQAQQSAHPLWCSVCSVQCNSQQQYTTHCDSPHHNHMVQQVAIIQQQQALTAAQTVREKGDASHSGDQQLNELPLENTTGTTVSCGFVPIHPALRTPPKTMNTSGEIPPDGVEFNGSRGHCYVCGIELTSLQHKNQHVEGKQHKKKALAFGSRVGTADASGTSFGNGGGGEEGVMMCSICNVPLSGELNVQQHFSGSKHRARKMEHDYQMASARVSPPFTMSTGGLGIQPPFEPPVVPPETGTSSFLHGPNSMPGRQVSFPGHGQPEQTQSYSHQSTGVDQATSPFMSAASHQSPESLKCEWHLQKGGVCRMCDQQFQSREEYLTHLGSSEHKQREDDILKPKCEICSVQYSGPLSAKQHLNGEKHKQRVLYNQLVPANGTAVPGTSGMAGLGDTVSQYRNQLPVMSMTTSQLSHRLSDIDYLENTFRKVVLEGTAFPAPPKTPDHDPVQSPTFPSGSHIPSQMPAEKVLNALDRDSSSQVRFTQINIPPSVTGGIESVGQQPCTARAVPEYVFDGARGVCNVCKIDFTSKSHAESHLAGAKHQKAFLRWQPTAVQHQDDVAAPMQAFIGIQGGAQAQYIPVGGNRGISPAPDASVPQQAYRFDGNRGYCYACKIDLSSEAHAKQHLVGKKHQTATERWILEGEACNYPLYCEVCYKPFTGQESAAQHFSSEKHKKKVVLSQGAAEGKKDPVTGALIIVRDGQMWYMCEVCKCPLNTAEQFKLHVNSPRHNAELEKSKQQDHSNRSSPIDMPYTGQPQASGMTGVAGPGADPSDFQHLVTRSSVKTTPGAYIPQPPLTQLDTAGLIKIETGSTGITALAPGIQGSYLQQPTQGLQHTVKTEPGEGSAFSAIARHSENSFSQGRGNSSDASSTQKEGNGAFRAVSGQTMANTSREHHYSGSSSVQQDGPLSIPSSQGQGQGHSGHRFNEGIFAELSQGLSVRQISRSSVGGRGGRSVPQALRREGDYEYDDEDDDSKSLPRSSSSADYQDQDREDGQGEENKSLAMSSVHSGFSLPEIAGENRLGASAVSTTSNNLSSIHTDHGSLTAPPGHLTLGSLAASGTLGTISEHPQQQPQEEPNPFKGFRFACTLCKQPMNTREDYERHMNGLKHQMKAATVRAPDKSGERLTKKEDKEVSFREAYNCCKTTPRTYQVELMIKAMKSDSSVIYLPTGTGKTLAAMMTLSRMLTLNPTRPVLFLVDKVLLVLQQARYIINELCDSRTFHRPDLTEDGKLLKRELKVAVLCGGLSVRDGTPLWKHDVIVTTAAFCQNLLQDEVLRWANFSLVVLDEAHHCTKNHPYNKLLSEHHLSPALRPDRRPKVLGLTASPAGRRTKEETLMMLKNLLQNLGGANIATVEEKIAKEQLDTYSSSARLVPVCVPMTEAEMGFHEKLLSYFICAYVELMRCSNLQQISSSALQALMRRKPAKTEDIKKFAQHLMSEPDELSEMVQLAQTARMKQNTVPLNRFENIRMHVMTVGMTLLNSEDGIDFVLDDLERLFNPHLNKCFDELMEMGLPCKEIATYVKTLCDAAKLRTSEGKEAEAEGTPSSMSIFQELLGTLANAQYMTWGSSDSMALVLVRERKVAHKFKDHLKRTSFVREQNMRVAVVVGHGAGGGEGEGMNLRKQDKVLQGIKSHRYDIVVATSVAEEGVDIPECQLVVCLNPPTTVKALVQMRGRARKKDSYFVVLCSSEREKEKLEDLQRQELNMKWAAAQLTQQNAIEQ